MEMTTCMHLGCSSEGVIACPHGQWCGAHILPHQRSDNDCRILIAEAIRVWTTKAAIPLIIALKAFPPSPFQEIPLDEIEREVFPVRLTAYIEAVKGHAELYRVTFESVNRFKAILEKQLNDVLCVIREDYEGEDMPLGLDDKEVLKWLEERMQSQKSNLPEH
jgi:hypothetical protein